MKDGWNGSLQRRSMLYLVGKAASVHSKERRRILEEGRIRSVEKGGKDGGTNSRGSRKRGTEN